MQLWLGGLLLHYGPTPPEACTTFSHSRTISPPLTEDGSGLRWREHGWARDDHFLSECPAVPPWTCPPPTAR
jgi:hypothetical protein